VAGTLANEDGIQVGSQSVKGASGSVSVSFTPLAVVGVHHLEVYVDGRLETETDIQVLRHVASARRRTATASVRKR
jgi:hypothetical protein